MPQLRGEELIERTLPEADKRAEPEAGPRPPSKNGKVPGVPGTLTVYWDQGKGSFWTLNKRGEWCEYSESQLKRLLRYHGVKPDKWTEEGLTHLENALLMLQQHNDVHFAGEVAGYLPGKHVICGQRVLITRGPRLIQPKAGEWPALKKFLQELLGDEVQYLHAWLRASFLSLKAGPPFRPGQLLAIAGPAGCGKSLLQDVLTEILGGRFANPYKFLTDETNFNKELFRAEHLMIEDDAASIDMRSRRHLASAVKKIVANQTHSLHPKGRDAIPLAPFWRLSFTLNDDADHLMVLPPLDSSLLDKIILLKASRATFPFRPDEPAGRTRFRERLSSELPAYLFWLRRWSVPSGLADQRYGSAAYQNGELASALQELEPENKFWLVLQVLDVIPKGNSGWTGTAAKLEMLMREKDRSGDVARLCYFNSAVGSYLQKLSVKYPEQVKKVSNAHGVSKWHIVLPYEDDPYITEKESVS